MMYDRGYGYNIIVIVHTGLRSPMCIMNSSGYRGIPRI